MTIHKINTIVYLVHRTYVDEKINNGTIRVCRVKSYENINGKIYPVLQCTGSIIKPDMRSHYLYETLEAAVKAIDTGNTIKFVKKPKLKSNGKKHK